MKASLLTIHDIYNYGSILQAYATQRAIQSIGVDVSIIDYKYPNPVHQDMADPLATLKSTVLSRTNAFLKDLLPGKPQSSYVRNYREAKNAWYSLSPREYRNREELRATPPETEAFVIGSDQVWHPRTAGRDDSFFLDFAPNGARKIAFASSFGATTISKVLYKDYERGINNIDFLSVREKSGAELIKKITGRHAEVVLDPTLLLDNQQWASEAKQHQPDSPYILCYGGNPGNNYMERLGLHISRKTGWKVVRLNGKFHDYFSRNIHYVLDAGPMEFLGLFINARLIIGQSFHATAFAVNMKRPFISLLRGEDDHDARQRDFLEMVGMLDHSLVCGDPLPEIGATFLEPTFESAHSRLTEGRQASFDFLKRAFT